MDRLRRFLRPGLGPGFAQMVCLPSAWLPKNPYSLSQVPVARLNVGLGGVNPNTLDAFNGYWGVKMNSPP